MAPEDFESWFLDCLWDVERSSDSKAQDGFHKVEGLLAEASHAHWSLDAIRKELVNALRPFRSSARVVWKTGQSDEIQNAEETYSSAKGRLIGLPSVASSYASREPFRVPA